MGWRINNKFLQRVHHFGSETHILVLVGSFCIILKNVVFSGFEEKKYIFSLYISYISESQLFLSINENTKK